MAVEQFQVGEWTVHPTLNRLSRGGGEVRVEPKVMQVLEVLAETPGDVVTRETLVARVWPDVFVSEDVLHRAIRGHETGHVHEQEMAGMARAQGASWLAREPIDIIQDTLLPLSPVQPLDSDGNRTQAIRQCVLDPVYQLK